MMATAPFRIVKATAMALALALAVTLGGSVPSALAQVSGQAFEGFSRDSDDPIQIEADRLTVLDAQKKAIFEGRVKVVQGTSVITTDAMTVFYASEEGASQSQSSDIERLELDGNVVVTSGDSTATGDAGTYETGPEIAILTGDVVVSQGDNAARGCKLTAFMKTNRVKLDSCGGRVKTIFTPGQPKEE